MSDAEKFTRMIHKAVQSADAATSVREILDTITEFAVGDRVKKVAQNFKFVGVVCEIYDKPDGSKCYAIKNRDGDIHVSGPQHLSRVVSLPPPVVRW